MNRKWLIGAIALVLATVFMVLLANGCSRESKRVPLQDGKQIAGGISNPKQEIKESKDPVVDHPLAKTKFPYVQVSESMGPRDSKGMTPGGAMVLSYMARTSGDVDLLMSLFSEERLMKESLHPKTDPEYRERSMERLKNRPLDMIHDVTIEEIELEKGLRYLYRFNAGDVAGQEIRLIEGHWKLMNQMPPEWIRLMSKDRPSKVILNKTPKKQG